MLKPTPSTFIDIPWLLREGSLLGLQLRRMSLTKQLDSESTDSANRRIYLAWVNAELARRVKQQ